jgi:hypothetical protein
MSKLVATDNFKTNNWSLDIEDLAPNYADLFIGFTNEAPIVEFKGLKFGYELKQGDNIKQYGMYPPPGVRYVRSDQAYLVVQRLNLKPEQTYTLFLWAENDGKRFEKDFEFTTPKPIQPYPSWTWDGEKWNPPVPYPEDGKLYTWNEDLLNWVEVEN